MAGALTVSLALSGGAARGAFHLGVIAAMERLGIEIGAISGTSIGSVIAVGIGSGVSAFDLLRLFQSKAFRAIFELNYCKGGLFKINEYAAILKEIAPMEDLEAMKIPTIVTCVDLKQGEVIYFDHGKSIPLAIASSALIPLFRPIVYEGYALIDGGFMDNLPIKPLQSFSYPLISVNLFPPSNVYENRFLGGLQKAIGLSLLASSKQQIMQSDVCISHEGLNQFGLFTFREMMRCFELGYTCGNETLLTFMSQKSII